MWIYKLIDNLSRANKIIIILFADLFLAYISLYVSILLRLDQYWSQTVFTECLFFIVFLPFIIIVSSYIFETYKLIITFFNFNDVEKLFKYVISVSLFFTFINFLFDVSVPRSIPLLFGLNFFSSIILIRLFLKSFLKKRYTGDNKIIKKNIIIYGAGAAGIRVLRGFELSNEINIIGFIDDNKNLKNLKIDDINIFDRRSFINKFKKFRPDEIWIAIPSLDKNKFLEISNFSHNYTDKVLALPFLNKLLFTGQIENSLKEVNPSTFLNRDEIDIDTDYFGECYLNKNILITGGGGSIGSEISKQLVKLKPNTIILLDCSEHALYLIDSELQELCKDNKITIYSLLGNICDEYRISEVLNKYNVEIIIHTAAYKHVPLVEANIIDGFQNNVLGTYKLVNTVIKSNNLVERIILISSDKAVRSSSVMGKTKRISEKIFQTLHKNDKNINFGIVRFGNVLGSSGSVIPLFKKQILKGGPVTITDPEMTRFFMSIEEASQLVLLAGSYAIRAEIFLLDMGKPVRIIDLAKNMIKFYGYELENENMNKDQIKIEVINKRPGEKLYEELLINNSARETSYPKVMIDNIKNQFIENIDSKMLHIEELIKKRDIKKIINLVNNLGTIKI